MFEALETGKFLSDKEFERRGAPLRQQLLKTQFELAARDLPVIVVVAGVDGAGKGRLVHRLNVWMDPRGIETNALWMHSDEEESRPYFWRFWRKLPPRGEIGVFLGSWYTRALRTALDKQPDSEWRAHYLKQVNDFERMLIDDGYRIVKLWLHVGRETQRQQLTEEAPQKQQNPRVGADDKLWWKAYPKVLQVAQDIILQTDTGGAPWHLLEAEDRNYREVAAGEALLQAMRDHLQRPGVDRRSSGTVDPTPVPADARQPRVLDTVDCTASLSKDKYRKKLNKYQARLQDLSWRAHRERRSFIAVFEGWDAAGKGSAIRRVTGAIDPRLYHLVQYAAPTDEERAHHYLWRFWRNIERDGRATLFDRSWYGRVLVERVEELASPGEWQRAYNEINLFEEQLVEHGVVLAKFWIHITPEEQLRRFHEREQTPHKQYKITPEDWRNRDKWHDYERAVEDMVAHTSTRHAPWTLVAGNDKRHARIQILKTLCKALDAAL
ncbi:polyphosphate:AMP phosphotransferase [Parahaliea mediterranea]|uniref:Polyphosphate:AMP phosphotransferase n=1 Tax=Parahaliea mediterranea TaxID=651086 RepID=A0A939DIB7_9GAMM|nr:polyphosphate:AMP phosphotransferase [Parahaliea mediterranea]MBN7798639.1 polyphosphate:AMP phosphotransferase [Parahaliea mediterranea]